MRTVKKQDEEFLVINHRQSNNLGFQTIHAEQ